MSDQADRKRPTLGVVAISHNEERNLPGFLSCVRGWADEIVIVDDGSTDATPSIVGAESGEVKFLVHRMSPETGFAGQRNVGIDAATSDWLLHLDCDERVTPELAREIIEAIRSEDLNGYRYRRLNYFLHRPIRHGGWNTWNRPQLARRGHHRFTGRIHEACEIEGGSSKTGQLRFEMLHLNEGSFSERLTKSAKYVDMTADALDRAGAPVSGWTILVRTLREFAKRYVLQRGFLDGTPGLIIALHAATTEFRALALVWDRQNRIPRAELESDIAAKWREKSVLAIEADARSAVRDG